MLWMYGFAAMATWKAPGGGASVQDPVDVSETTTNSSTGAAPRPTKNPITEKASRRISRTLKLNEMKARCCELGSCHNRFGCRPDRLQNGRTCCAHQHKQRADLRLTLRRGHYRPLDLRLTLPRALRQKHQKQRCRAKRRARATVCFLARCPSRRKRLYLHRRTPSASL